LPELIYDEEATQKLQQIQRDRQWFNENYERIKNENNEMFVAIKDRDVIDKDKNLHTLVQKIVAKYPKNHRSIIIEHITNKNHVYVL
jgi:nicotinamide riboside kinase